MLKPSRFLKELEGMMICVPDEFLENKEMIKAMELSEEASFNEGELLHYQDYLDALRTEKTVYRCGVEDGEEIGMKKGREKGREEGIEIGEKQAKIEMARNLLSLGIDRDTIKKATGLDDRSLERL